VAVKAAEEDAFRQYAAETMRRHYRYALVLSGNHHDAEDLVQHAMTELYLRWGRVVGSGSPDAYVRRILTNRFIDVRRSARSRREEQWADPPETEAGAPPVADVVVDGMLLSGLLDQLNPRERAAVVLRYLDDASTADVAAALRCSERQVKRYLKSALEIMAVDVQEVHPGG